MAVTARTLAFCLLGLSACATTGVPDQASERSVAPGANDRYATEEGRAMSIRIFEGEGRDEYQKPDEIVRNLALDEGDVVCEVGAGSGYFTPYLSKAVGPAGRVYAEDPQREFLDALRQKAETQGLRNVQIVVGTYTDTRLPDGVCDVTFILDAYHHFEWPRTMLAAIEGDTRPGGRLVIVDWYRRPNDVFAKWSLDPLQHLRLDLDGVIREIEGEGWRHVDTRTFLDHQYFVVFERRGDP
jgi:predicted methyltransferase